MVQWYNETMVQWYNGPMVQRKTNLFNSSEPLHRRTVATLFYNIGTIFALKK